MQIKAIVMNETLLIRTITRMAHEILEKNNGTKDLVFIGIRTRGVPLANRLAIEIKKINGKTVPVGLLDVTSHRDDLDTKAYPPEVRESDIRFDIKNKTIILVDDVLFTGRTVRAALDTITELGRPRQVFLCVLIDRGHRELQIKADFVGKNIPTSMNEIISVNLKEIDKEDNVKILSYN